MNRREFSALFLTSVGSIVANGKSHSEEAGEIKVGTTFAAKDSLHCGEEAAADAAACLDGLKWNCQDFAVRAEPAEPGRGDWRLRFPTPFPSGEAANDSVAMEWYLARDEMRRPKRAPGVIVVHESGRGMVAGRLFAKGLQTHGFHTFLVHLPGYGARTSAVTGDIKRLFPCLRQAVADVRRARDAAAAAPLVDSSQMGLHGTSMGGFVAATVAGLDRAFQKSFILLAGGQLSEVLIKGQKDAASLHRQLAEAGVTDEHICRLTLSVEPLRLAHRIDSANTWLFSGKFDEVVPPACSQALAKAANLPAGHFLEFPAGHYTAAMFMPAILQQIADLMAGRQPAAAIPGTNREKSAP